MMTQTFDPLRPLAPLSDPLPLRGVAHPDGFTTSMENTLQELQTALLDLNGDFIPKVNAVGEDVHTLLPHLGAVNAAPAAASAAASSASDAAASAMAALAAQEACEGVKTVLTEGASVEAVPDVPVLRNTRGSAQFPDPEQDLEAANKRWTLGQIGTASAALAEGIEAVDARVDALPLIPEKATQAQVNAGNAVDAYIPPDILKAWFATTYAQATQAQVNAGTNVSRYISPNLLSAWFATTNAKATQAQVNAGTAVNRYVSPDLLNAWLNTNGAAGFGKLKAWARIAATGTALLASRNIVSAVWGTAGLMTLTITSGALTNINKALVFVQPTPGGGIASLTANLTSLTSLTLQPMSGVGTGGTQQAMMVALFEGM